MVAIFNRHFVITYIVTTNKARRLFACGACECSKSWQVLLSVLACQSLITMPSFQPWGQAVQPSRLPPTPPEYLPTYQTPASMMAEQSYYGASSDYLAQHGHSGRDFIDRYTQASDYVSQQAINAQNHTRVPQMQGSQDYRKIPPYVAQLPQRYQYGSMAVAPPLPPIRARDNLTDPVGTQYRIQDAQIQKQKAQAPSGGVSAHLDYDMDVMANFVAEMAQGIISPGSRPTPQFLKYVLAILSSTRLPSSTIVLALFYLASRMKIVSANGEATRSSSCVYRMLTTCLLLGSKFLDDNTFQNRSWADVSQIPVMELNKMELDWLKGFDWTLHGPMYNETEGFYMWREHWKAYQEDAQLAKTRESQKLTPIDTTITRLQQVQQTTRQPFMSPEGPIPLQYQRSSQYDTQWVRPFLSDYSPPSAPHTGPTTPDYYANGNWSQAPPPYSKQSWASNSTPVYTNHRSQPPSYPHTPSYIQGYAQSVWNKHGPSCTCTLCPKHHEHYFTHPNVYGLQSVAG
ncbi:hypothetical protein GJ744_012213 [Endocarpon pusillum]|uniref:Cyclin N-terminal domain-containing protein n=1 Tax=Endocarpon pusillum TaxID=364733 RepID=A0A8H7AEU9_9EURO|nr:hypothetical protein GJ744_012213 [Endocarpon pusillum]